MYIVHLTKVLNPGKNQIRIRIRIAHLRNWSGLYVGIYSQSKLRIGPANFFWLCSFSGNIYQKLSDRKQQWLLSNVYRTPVAVRRTGPEVKARPGFKTRKNLFPDLDPIYKVIPDPDRVSKKQDQERKVHFKQKKSVVQILC
jgi:hypothetical protein